MAGRGDEKLPGGVAFGGQRACVRGGNIAARQVHAVSPNGQGDVRAMVDQQSRPALGANHLQGFAGEQLKITDREIFLAELNVIDSCGSGAANRSQELRAAFGFASRKLAFDP